MPTASLKQPAPFACSQCRPQRGAPSPSDMRLTRTAKLTLYDFWVWWPRSIETVMLANSGESRTFKMLRLITQVVLPLLLLGVFMAQGHCTLLHDIQLQGHSFGLSNHSVSADGEVPELRRKLRSGDDSHCGVVVERKGEIALIETAIGQKWLKVRQLHQPGARGCRFVNGILQE